MWDVILDALVDSAKTLPFLLLIYFVIEFLESNQKAKYKTVKLLNGKFAPVIAGGIGLVPQCGFSVMATDLFCQNYLKLGTLIAFFVAASDEALPILLTNAQTVGDWRVWVAFGIKVVYAVLLGFFINIFDKRALSAQFDVENELGCCHHHVSQPHTEAELPAEPDCRSADSNAAEAAAQAANHDSHDTDDHAYAHRNRAWWRRFWKFAAHPLLHTAKLFVYIFVVNAVFGLIMFYSEQSIADFTQNVGIFQCFITAAVGLVPNCASSVIICGMKTQGIIGVSAMLSGLVSNSGIALAVLFRQKKWKRNLGIVAILYFAGVVLGLICYPFLG